MTIKLNIHDKSVEIVAGEREVASYVTSTGLPADETPKPYFHPVRTPAGTVITDFRPDDHLWHHGLWYGMPSVNDSNMWGGVTYVGVDNAPPETNGYVSLPNQGEIRHLSWESISDSEAEEQLDWLDRTGAGLLTETRQIQVRQPEPSYWVMDFRSTLTNASDVPVVLETPAQGGRPDGGYGGLFLRLNPELRVQDIVGDNGPLTTSGSASDWILVHAESSDGQQVTLGLGHASDWPREKRWLLRSGNFEGFNWSIAYEDALQLEPGESLSLGHRLLIADGSLSRAELDETMRAPAPAGRLGLRV